MNYILIVPCISKIFKCFLLFEIRKYDVQENKTSYNLFVHSGLDFIPTHGIEKKGKVYYLTRIFVQKNIISRYCTPKELFNCFQIMKYCIGTLYLWMLIVDFTIAN